MRVLRIVIIFVFLWGAADALAQAPSGLSSMPEQWQLTLDVIKAKAQTLLMKNNAIQAEYRQLTEQKQHLKEALKDKQDRDEATRLFLKERHNRTDQQLRLGELNQAVKIKRQQARVFQDQLENLTKKQADLESKLQLQKIRISDMQLRQDEQKQKISLSADTTAAAVDGQLADLRKRLEEEKKQEVLLENQWDTLKSSKQSQDLNVDTITEQNKQLARRLKDLEEQKLMRQGESAEAARVQANQQKYNELEKRKEELEADITSYETRLDQLKDPSALTLSWPVEKKKLIHQMVQKDARNNQLRGKIKILQEDVSVLRDQVAKFERQVDFIQGKDKIQQ